jgi:hypothetical protein
MRSMRNGIWAARCGDAGADTIAEAASKRNENALSEITGSIVHGAGLRKAGRGNPNPHRRPQPLHRSWHTCHRGSRLSPSGERGSSPSGRFAQQSLGHGITDVEKNCVDDQGFWIMRAFEINGHEGFTACSSLQKYIPRRARIKTTRQTLRQNLCAS